MKFLERRKGSPKFDKEVDTRLLKKVAQGERGDHQLHTAVARQEGRSRSGSRAHPESRAVRDGQEGLLHPRGVAKIIEKRDRENYMLYKRLYGIEFGKDLSPFQLVVGTDGVAAEKVAKEILDYISSDRLS